MILKEIKADLIEEVLGFLILTGASTATRDLMRDSLHLVKYKEIVAYRDSLAEDLNIGKNVFISDIEKEI
jgi:hypothetical protein